MAIILHLNLYFPIFLIFFFFLISYFFLVFRFLESDLEGDVDWLAQEYNSIYEKNRGKASFPMLGKIKFAFLKVKILIAVQIQNNLRSDMTTKTSNLIVLFCQAQKKTICLKILQTG